MSDRFLNTSGSGNTDLTNGTVNAFLSSLTVSSLAPSLPLKTNSVNTLISARLDIRDINTLESRLDSIVANPFNGVLAATDFETDDYFSLNTEIQKTDNLLASTQTPNITNISGLTKSTELATDRLYDTSQAVFIDLDATNVDISATNLTFNGNPILTDGATIRAAAGSLTAPSYSFTGDTNTGVRAPYADAVSIVANGTDKLIVDNNATYSANVIHNLDGAVANPSYSFMSDPNTGLYRPYGDALSLSCGGNDKLILDLNSTYSANKIQTIDGTVSLPSYSFMSDPNTGMFSSSADSIGLTTGGVNRMSIGNSTISTSNTILTDNGTPSLPSYSFNNSVSTGMFSSSADTIGLATAGVNRLSINTAGITSTLPILNFSGTASLPTKTFDGDIDTGIYNPAANTIGLSTGGVNRMIIDSLGLSTTVPLMIPDGSESSPALTFNNDLNSGIYSGGANSVNIVAGAVNRVNVSSSGLEATVPIIVPTGNLANPSIKFTGVNDAGIYRSNTDEISITTAGVQKFTIERFVNTSHVVFRNMSGTAATPAYSFTADGNLGMYSPGPDALGFTVNSANRLLIDGDVNVLTVNLRHSGSAFELNGSGAYRIGGTAANNAEVRWNTARTDLTLGSTILNNILVSPTEISMRTQTGGITFIMDNAGNMLYPNFNEGTLQTSSIGLISASNNTKSVFRLNSSTANLVYSDAHIDLNWDATNKQLMFSLNTLPTGLKFTDISNLFQTGTTISSVTDDIDTAVLGVDKYFSTNGVRSATFDHVGFGATSTLHLCTEGVQAGYPSYKITVQTGSATLNLTIVVNKYFN